MKKMSVVIFLLLSSFFVSQKALAANTDIVINEIGAYAASTHEWIEIWNKGNEPTDLTGWKFWENNTNHGLSVSTTDAVVAAGEYAVIVQDAGQFILDYPGFSGSIFDSSWSGLNEGGEEIGLKDASGNFIEKFTYISAPNFSLQRRDANLADYTGANWAEHASSNTAGAVNDFSSPIQEPETPASPVPQTNNNPTSQIILESPASDLTPLKINELAANPEAGNEWVELYNTGSADLDLGGALICDSRNSTSTCKKASGNIKSGGWMMVDLGTRSFLNNDGDSVILKDRTGMTIDRVDYDDELVPDKGQSLARVADGADTDNDSDWVVTDKLTPGEANIIEGEEDVLLSAGTDVSGTVKNASTTMKEDDLEIEVVISEILPNPKGDDAGEFIEIKNNSLVQANLSGWFFKNKEKKYVFPDDTVIFPGSFIVFYKTATKISIVNTSGKIELFNKNKDQVDFVSYDKPPGGKSYGLVEDEWEWMNPTPGKENAGMDEGAEVVVAGKTSGVKYKSVNSIAAARQASKGTWATVKGVVAVLPGVFGSQYFYLVSGNAGIQIYQNKKDFPELVVGDEVQISGTVSEANGIKRINIKSKNNVDILSVDRTITGTELNLDEIDESLAGGLVWIEGEITEIKSSLMYMDNGFGEIAVYFKQGAKINKSRFQEGENARVTGILEQTKSGWQIWPRSNDDLESLGPSADLLKKQTAAAGGDTTEKYLTATAGGVTTLILAFFARARGAFLKRGLLILIGFIKKDKT